MRYFYQNNGSNQLIVLFHGTGGNEYQLLQSLGDIYIGADVLSFEGNYGRGFRRRFFPPLVDGKRDEVAFKEAIHEFKRYYQSLALEYDKLTFVGYSNGANFILGLLENEFEMDEAVLLHPSNLNYHFSAVKHPIKVIITVGANDYISTPGEIKKLEKQMVMANYDTEFVLLDSGHELSDEEVKNVKQLLN